MHSATAAVFFRDISHHHTLKGMHQYEELCEQPVGSNVVIWMGKTMVERNFHLNCMRVFSTSTYSLFISPHPKDPSLFPLIQKTPE